MVALSSAHGYEETTVDALAKLAGVSKGSFYEHFACSSSPLRNEEASPGQPAQLQGV